MKSHTFTLEQILSFERRFFPEDLFCGLMERGFSESEAICYTSSLKSLRRSRGQCSCLDFMQEYVGDEKLHSAIEDMIFCYSNK